MTAPRLPLDGIAPIRPDITAKSKRPYKGSWLTDYVEAVAGRAANPFPDLPSPKELLAGQGNEKLLNLVMNASTGSGRKALEAVPELKAMWKAMARAGGAAG